MFEGCVSALKEDEDDARECGWKKEGMVKGRDVNEKMVRELENVLAVRSEKRERLRKERREKRQRRIKREVAHTINNDRDNLSNSETIEHDLQQDHPQKCDETVSSEVKEKMKTLTVFESEDCRNPLPTATTDHLLSETLEGITDVVVSSSSPPPSDSEMFSSHTALMSGLTSQLAVTVANIAANRRKTTAAPAEETFGSEDEEEDYSKSD